MAAVSYCFAVRDYAASPPGTRMAGLTPSWVFLKRLSDGSDVAPQPTIAEIAQGQYKFAYDPELLGEASGQIDVGGAVPSPADRYVDVVLTLDSSRVLAGINGAGQVRLAPAGLDAIAVEAGVNARQALAPILAAAAGALSGAGTGTVVIQGANGAPTRITATTDGAGNRTAVTLALPA